MLHFDLSFILCTYWLVFSRSKRLPQRSSSVVDRAGRSCDIYEKAELAWVPYAVLCWDEMNHVSTSVMYCLLLSLTTILYTTVPSMISHGCLGRLNPLNSPLLPAMRPFCPCCTATLWYPGSCSLGASRSNRSFIARRSLHNGFSDSSTRSLAV